MTEPTYDLSPSGVNAMLAAEFPGTGNECVDLGSTHAVARRDIEPGFLRPGGFVSGPTQFALADAALWYVTFAAIGRVEPMALTSELSIRFLRPATGSVLWARASLESSGSRQIVGSVRVWTDENAEHPSSVAQCTYVLPRER